MLQKTSICKKTTKILKLWYVNTIAIFLMSNHALLLPEIITSCESVEET